MKRQEKRRHKRTYIKLPVECRGKSYWQYIEARDISAGGMFVVTDKVEPPRTKVEIMFELGEEKDKKFILAEGAVAWNRPNPIMDETGKVQSAGMGIMFTKLTPLSAKEFIDQLVKRMEDKSA